MRRAVVLALVLVARPAAADKVAVKVIDVAGDTAYVQPGVRGGIVPGTKVRFGNRDYTVVEATDQTAALALGKSTLAIGDSGTAEVIPGHAERRTDRLPPPPGLDTFKDQWPTAERPAANQKVDEVPLGAAGRAGTTHLAVFGHLFGNVDKSGSGGQLEARVVTSFDVLHERPLGADLDGAVRLFATGTNSAEKTPVFFRAAQLRYGDPADPALALGRLRYAATSLGMLDGGRAAFHTGNLEIAAFGGIVPDPVSGQPSTDASRFGAEMIYDRASSPWRPRVAVTAHGSTWTGQLDERRLSIAASASHGANTLDGWAEVSQFSADNPWGEPAVDLSGAGGTYEWRHRGNHLGLDVTFLRPERSLRLASALNPNWQCALMPQRGDAMESCLGGDFWLAATASAGMRRPDWSLEAVGSLGETQSISSTFDASGYVRAEMGHVVRVVMAASGGHTGFSAWVAGDFGFTAAPTPRLDVSLTYRPERLDYVAATEAYFLNSLVADVHWEAASTFAVALSAIGTTGADRDMLALLTTLVWRPLP